MKPIALAAFFVLLSPHVGVAAMAEQGRGLAGTSWQLSSLAGKARLPAAEVTLRFGEDNRLSGTDGCNQYTGRYEQDGHYFRVAEPLAVTKRACPRPLTQQADAFRDVLFSAREADREGGRMALMDRDGNVLAQFTEQSGRLADTLWRVTGYNNGKQAVVSVLRGTELTLVFDGETLAGTAGCNRFQSAYSLSGERIRIGAVSATKRMCARPEGIIDQETTYLAALERVELARREAGRLELRSASGALQVTAVLVSDAAGKAIVGGLQLPATFRGDLPCADCEALRYHLDLWPDHVFHLRRAWLGRPDHREGDGEKNFSLDDIGRWGVDDERQVLLLSGGGTMSLQFEIKGPKTLRATDVRGNPIDSQLPYELVSNGSLEPTDVELILGGEFRYMADAPLFLECMTGRSYPVVMEGAYIELERSYLASDVEPGAPLYTTIRGKITRRLKMEGAGSEPRLVVNRFVNTWPTMSCERSWAVASLINTYWRIISLGDLELEAVEGQPEPHLLLRAMDDRLEYRATVGCNQIMGSYSLNETAIHFAPRSTTLMACPPPLDAWEQALVRALAAARTSRVKGDSMELLDEGGNSIGLFQAAD